MEGLKGAKDIEDAKNNDDYDAEEDEYDDEEISDIEDDIGPVVKSGKSKSHGDK